jgi:hypothetical protein
MINTNASNNAYNSSYTTSYSSRDAKHSRHGSDANGRDATSADYSRDSSDGNPKDNDPRNQISNHSQNAQHDQNAAAMATSEMMSPQVGRSGANGKFSRHFFEKKISYGNNYLREQGRGKGSIIIYYV